MNRIAITALALSLLGCSKVPAGHVGIKIHLLGGEKGVDHEVLGVGRYWIGVNEELHLFPVFEQNPKYTKASEEDAGDAIYFQTREGMQVNGDFSITYSITPASAAVVFQRYRVGIDEINRGPLRNMLRDAINEVASEMTVEGVYGPDKVKMVDIVTKLLTERAKASGLEVTQVSLLGAIRLPESVVDAINSKMSATQKAEQRENELRESEAEARKQVAQANGEAQKAKALAEGRAAALLTEAEAQAKANRILSASLTTPLIEYRKIDRWDGKLPTTALGSTSPLVAIGR